MQRPARLAAGIGPLRAVKLIQQHGSLEKVMDKLDATKYGIPEPFPYHEARRLFQGRPCWLSSAMVASPHNLCLALVLRGWAGRSWANEPARSAKLTALAGRFRLHHG